MLILWLVMGPSNVVWELSGQYPLDQCQALASQRIAVARQMNPGVTVVGGCYEVAR